ncbi:MAG: hypothetical protein M1814_001770 [Vezdaea aestivalis]|nr:MAG: hypothetical protein M1814_001770 [Vezdaea aestivalis]
MSSMRNAVQRRNHKERSQPKERTKWGLLEKHKDYSLRAKSYNEKKARLQVLREKASLRNPDEFSYGMLSAKTDRHGAKIAARGNPVLSNEAARLLKTQDAGYLRVVAARIRKEREHVENAWVNDLSGDGAVSVIGNASTSHVISRKTVFVADTQEQLEWTQQSSNDVDAMQENVVADDVDGEDTKALRRARRAALRSEENERVEEALRKKIQKQHASQVSRAKALKNREQDITKVATELELQRAKMGKSQVVGGVNKRGIKFKVKQRRKR